MFSWLKRTPASPLDAAEQAFVEETILWFSQSFGWAPVLGPVLVPTTQFFPRDWAGSDAELELLFDGICQMLSLERDRIKLVVIEDEADPIQSLGNLYETQHSGAAGLYFHKKEKGRFVVAITESSLADPGSLVATVAHELCHVLLLGEKRLDLRSPRHEEVTDLLTIFFGLGVFTANSAFQFSQWQDGGWQGWSTRRLGYLTEAQLGYALAAHAFLRSETSPPWFDFVASGVLHYVKQTTRYLGSEVGRANTRLIAATAPAR
jgi:hypothetical protein